MSCSTVECCCCPFTDNNVRSGGGRGVGMAFSAPPQPSRECLRGVMSSFNGFWSGAPAANDFWCNVGNFT
jgi:hypothetical protein